MNAAESYVPVEAVRVVVIVVCLADTALSRVDGVVSVLCSSLVTCPAVVRVTSVDWVTLGQFPVTWSMAEVVVVAPTGE